jgi:hypothetical protein
MLRSALIVACVIGSSSIAGAQYVMVLKNGRQITVQSYREDGALIRFSGLGGEAAIGKDQVQSIRRAGESERSAIFDSASGRPAPPASPPAPLPAKSAPAEPTVSRSAEIERASAGRAEEERAFREKVKELTGELKKLRERYALLTRGNTGPEPKLFTTEAEFRGHQEDLLSRLRDAQYRAQGLPTGESATSPPFSLDAPPAYSAKEKELSELRRRMSQVEDARQKLIDEMKLKNFDTGALFLD